MCSMALQALPMLFSQGFYLSPCCSYGLPWFPMRFLCASNRLAVNPFIMQYFLWFLCHVYVLTILCVCLPMLSLQPPHQASLSLLPVWSTSMISPCHFRTFFPSYLYTMFKWLSGCWFGHLVKNLDLMICNFEDNISRLWTHMFLIPAICDAYPSYKQGCSPSFAKCYKCSACLCNSLANVVKICLSQVSEIQRFYLHWHPLTHHSRAVISLISLDSVFYSHAILV